MFQASVYYRHLRYNSTMETKMVYTIPNLNGFQPGTYSTLLIFSRTLWITIIIITIFIIIVRLVAQLAGTFDIIRIFCTN